MNRFVFGIITGIGYCKYKDYRRMTAFFEENPDHEAAVVYKERMAKLNESVNEFVDSIKKSWENAKTKQKFNDIISTIEENN